MIQYLLVTLPLLTIFGGHHAYLQMATTPQESKQTARASLPPPPGAPDTSFPGVQKPSQIKINHLGRSKGQDQNKTFHNSSTFAEDTHSFVHQQENWSDPQTGSDLPLLDIPQSNPKQNLCGRRSDRRRILFQNKIAGNNLRKSPGNGGTYNRTPESQTSCRS